MSHRVLRRLAVLAATLIAACGCSTIAGPPTRADFTGVDLRGYRHGDRLEACFQTNNGMPCTAEQLDHYCAQMHDLWRQHGTGGGASTEAFLAGCISSGLNEGKAK